MKSIYVILILCIDSSIAINFNKCEKINSAFHCYFNNITAVSSSPPQSVKLCMKPGPLFQCFISIYSTHDIQNSDTEYFKVLSSREFILNEEYNIRILINETCEDKPMENNTVTFCYNKTSDKSSRKLLVLQVEGDWKGRREFTSDETKNYFSNCDPKTSLVSYTESDYEKAHSQISADEVKPYYIIIILGLGLPFLGAMFAVVFAIYYRKKEKKKLETIEMEVMETKSQKTDQKKTELEEINGPCYINVGAFDERQEEEVGFQDSNEISYIELDLEQTNNKNSKPKKHTGSNLNGSKVADAKTIKSLSETPETIYSSIIPEAKEDLSEKDGDYFVDNSVAYVNVTDNEMA